MPVIANRPPRIKNKRITFSLTFRSVDDEFIDDLIFELIRLRQEDCFVGVRKYVD